MDLTVPATGTNLVVKDGNPTDGGLLSPFPAWQPAAGDEQRQPQAESQSLTTTTAHAKVRGLRSSPSASSSVQQSLSAQNQQQQPRPKRFNLRDGAREAITEMRKLAEAKQMVVAEALYGFYNTEINLHFLHALSAYFIHVAKDITLARREQERDLSPHTGTDGHKEGDRHARVQERVVLLQEVGRSYGRVIVYCSNFERTTADALFFESLLCLARMVVAAAVAEPSLASEVDTEFDRILRGGVFHPTAVRPVPRPPVRPRHKSALRSPPETPLGGRSMFSRQASRPLQDGSEMHSRSDQHDVDDGDDGGGGDDANKGSNGNRKSQKRRGVLRAGEALNASSGPPRGSNTRGVPRRGEKRIRGGSAGPGRRTGPAAESISSRGPTNEGSPTASTTRPRSNKNNERSGDWGVPGTTRTRTLQSLYNNGGGSGRRHRLGDATRNVGTPSAGAQEASARFPAFDELSRWRVARGSVSKMLRQASEAQRVALSNLGLAEGYRRAVAAQFQKKSSGAAGTSATTPATSFATVGQAKYPMRPEVSASSVPPGGSNVNDIRSKDNTGGDGQQRHQTQSRSKAENGCETSGTRSPSVCARAGAGAAAAGGKVSFWKRRGRALTPRRTQDARAVPATHGSDQVQKDFFCADALSVCIASVVD